ncbi:MAG: ABC transporter permease subunit [Candidatus Methylomirabilis sp.]|nr:ABC transporter permease subunit [Deltaproteobacteria bacterium]
MKRAATPARPPAEEAIPRLAETLAHKLRNPLGSIQACADVLGKSLALEGEEAALLEAVRTDARRLKFMIDDFAMLAGAPRVREGAVALGDALRDALALAPLADPVHREVDLRVEVPEGLPPLSADRDALTHALYTVVANAFEAVERSGVVTIRARLEGMDLTLETAAADLYATPWQAFRHVTLPPVMPGIAAGLMLAFVTSLDDVVITLFVKSAGQDTLPTYMLAQIRRSVSAEVNAISALLLLLTVILLTAFFLLTRKRN